MNTYLKGGLKAARIIFLSFLLFYAVGFLTASLLYDAARSLTDSGTIDPFTKDGSTVVWINIVIWVLALAGTWLGYRLFLVWMAFLDKRYPSFRKTFFGITILALVILAMVSIEAAWVSVGKLNLAEKRLEKVIALYGPKVDMCQVLKLGMSREEMVAIMGLPTGKNAIADCHDDQGCSELYCPEAGDCRAVSLNKMQKIIKIECWTGKAIGLPLE